MGFTDMQREVPALAPPGETRSNAAIFRALAARMGFTEPCFKDSDEAMARGIDPGLFHHLADGRFTQWLVLGFNTARHRLPVAGPPCPLDK